MDKEIAAAEENSVNDGGAAETHSAGEENVRDGLKTYSAGEENAPAAAGVSYRNAGGEAAAGVSDRKAEREAAAGVSDRNAERKAGRTLRRERIMFLCFDVLPIALFMPAIIACAAVFGQKFIKVLPVAVSLFVVLLSAHANRYTFLIGAANSVIYSVGYFMERLYASVASALLLSFPVQLVSFILWKRRSYRNTSRNIRFIPPKNYFWLVPLFAGLWAAFYWLFSAAGSSNTALDNTMFILGIFSSFFLMLGFFENVFVSLASTSLGIWLWTTLTIGNIANITYLLYYVYLLFRQVQMLFIWRKLCREQRAAGKAQPACRNTAKEAERAA